MLHRRGFLISALSGAGLCSVSGQLPFIPSALAQMAATPDLRGSINAQELGVRANALDEQSTALQNAIDTAVSNGRPLFLPPGRYEVGNITLSSGLHLIGVPGTTRLVYNGKGHFLIADNADRLSLSHLVLDGEGRGLRDYALGLLHGVNCRRLSVQGVEAVNSARSGIVLEGCQGRIERSLISGVNDTAIFLKESRGMSIEGNIITNAGNNGIQVWRSVAGEDATLVSGNKIDTISARAGGNGQNGNGINIFRAGSVSVTNNRIADCAFSAVRNNAGTNSQIIGNSCARLGEVAIFVEFGFQSSIVANNMIDKAAAGISVTNFDEGGRLAAVQGNVVRNIQAKSFVNPDTRPYGIAAEADAALNGNVVENSAGIGLLIGWGPYLRNVSAVGNVVRDADIGIAVSVAKGAGRAVISDNIVSKVKRGALVGMEWEKISTRDLAHDGKSQNTGTGANEGTHANITYRGNIVS